MCVMSGSESDYIAEVDESPPPPRTKSTRVVAKKSVNYVDEKVDNFFTDTKGYTNFQRTRKGGDKRPFAAGVQASNYVTLSQCIITLTHYV